MVIETGRKRADYAADPGKSRGRLRVERPSPTRNAFRRDCDRIIHSTAFRSLARALGLDEDLAEALALAHDLGHPPFGHAGERALDEALNGFGGFDHNAQALRIVTDLERRYAEFDGLNLTWETLEGLVKHNGPLTDRKGAPVARYRERGVPAAILAYNEIQDLQLWSQPSAEAQVAALSDDIAYDAHDIDDGLRADLFSLDDIAEVALVGDIVRGIRVQHASIDQSRRVHETVRTLITRMIEDVIAETGRRVVALKPGSAADVRHGL